MPTTNRLSKRLVVAAFSTLAVGAVSIPVTATPASAEPMTPVPVCAEGYRHCSTVRSTVEIDGGEHGHVSLSYNGGGRLSVTGDITG